MTHVTERELVDFFASVEEEFGVTIPPPVRAQLASPRDLVAFLLEDAPPPIEPFTADERREHLDAVLGELIKRAFGVSRYDDDAPFASGLRG